MKGILIDENRDLMVRNGSLVIGNCVADVAERIIGAWQGEFKEAPLLGGNIKKMTAGKPNPFWEGDMKAQLKFEGIPVSSVRLNEDGVELIIEE